MTEPALQRTTPLSGRARAGLIAGLLGLAAVAWVVTANRMDGMDMGPGTDLGGLGWFVGVWVTMMAAMMLPSVAPIVLMHARLAISAGATALFVAGYLIPWAAAGLLGYAVVEGLRSLDIGFLGWDEAGRYVAAGVILLAAVYQLTTAKGYCLLQCRSPLALVDHWRPGVLGALRMGVQHGGFCVGCCWALMAALFALGVMSVAWMVFIALVIAAEKLLPSGRLANRGISAVLAALALWIAVAPGSVPWLTIPMG